MFPEIGLNFLKNKDNSDYFETEPLDITELTDSSYIVKVDNQEYSVTLKSDNSVTIHDGSEIKEVVSTPSAQITGGQVIEAPLGGNIFRIIASEGEAVDADAAVLILEAMKMETEIKAPSAGIILAIFVKPGDTVKPGTPLFEIKNQ
jgi:oxaloacetate decarboxylase alpha subunit